MVSPLERCDFMSSQQYNSNVKALSHGAIFLATCNATLLPRDVNQLRMFDVLRIY